MRRTAKSRRSMRCAPGDSLKKNTYVSVSKVQQLLQGLQATGDEGQQLTAVMEMCQVGI